MSGKNMCLSQRDAGADWRCQKDKMLLATAAKDTVVSIPGEKQGDIYIVGIKSEEWVAILHLQ